MQGRSQIVVSETIFEFIRITVSSAVSHTDCIAKQPLPCTSENSPIAPRLVENIFINLKIALKNQLKRFCRERLNFVPNSVENILLREIENHPQVIKILLIW
jgi:hypothetical protein